MRNAPIIFIHYGDTPYLKYTLDIAKKTNPNKEVFLLGDEKNKKYAKKLSIKHLFFTKYDNTKSVKELDKNFVYIGGANRQTEQDKRFELFCFKRWFYLYEFMKENSLDKCWYFDSDTLILSDLEPEEEKFKEYDYTEEDNGLNMKGIIPFKHLTSLTRSVLYSFQDENILIQHKREFETQPNHTFCDMRGYLIYKNKYKPKSIRLGTIINKEMHDERITQDHEMETEYIPQLHRKIKKLYYIKGDVFEKTKNEGNLIKIKTIDMSWVTTSFIEKVYYYKINKKFPPFYISLLGKISRIPRFIKSKITKSTK